MAKGAGKLHLKFTSDIAKASQDVDRLGAKLDRLKTKAAATKWMFGSASVGFENKFFTRPGGWEKSPAFNREVRAFQQAQQMGQSMQQQWNKSFGSFGMGGMASLGGSPFGPNPKAMVEARQAVEQISKKASIFSRIMGGINEKTLRFMGSMGIVNPQIGMMATKFGLLGAAVMGLIGIVKHAVGQIAHFGNLVEGAKIQLTQFTSEKQAMADIRGARRYSLFTPFGPAEVLGATASARQFGIDPYGKNKYGLSGNKTAMDIIGGLASFRNPMTGEAIGMNRAAYAVAGGDTRLLRPFGVDVRQAYESAKGAGPVRSAAFVEKFITELGKMPKVLNMAEAQSDSIAGLWSTIAGFAEEFWMDLTGAGEETGVVTMWSQLRDILKDVRDGGLIFMNYISPYVTEFGTYLGAIFKYVWGLLKLIWDIVGPVLVPAFKIIIQLFRIVWEIGKGFMTTFIQLGKILVEIVSLPFKMLNAILGIKSGIEWIVSGLMKIVLGLQITFMFVQIFMEGLVKKISSVVNGIIDGIKLITSEISRAFDELVAKYENTWLGQFLKLIFSERGGAGAFGNKLNLVDPQTGKEFTPEQYKQLDEELKKQRKWEIDTTRTTGAVTGGISKTVEDFSGYSRAKKRSAARSQDREQRIIDNRSYHYNITTEPDREAIKNQTGSTKSQADKYRTGMPR